jgi:uncharacterized protein YcaQ
MRAPLDPLRRLATSFTLPPRTTVDRAIRRLGFVQADPIRAPARAQDLILYQRVKDYRAGDLDRRYDELGLEEDVFINYGYVTRDLHALMHPRPDVTVPADSGRAWSASRRRQAEALFAFVRARGVAHPREVDARLGKGNVKNYWGGSSRATTQLLDAMHYRGMLRIARRESGVRVYAAREAARVRPLGDPDRAERLDRLVDVIVGLYAPMPAASLSFYARRLRFAAPQWKAELPRAIVRAKERLASGCVDGVTWYWPLGVDLASTEPESELRLLAPFDPVVQDRTRFALLWGWEYRFEAYTPAHKRVRGYYALPLLWRGRVLGWGNLSVKGGRLDCELGFADGRSPRDRRFRAALDAELARMEGFLGLRDGRGAEG